MGDSRRGWTMVEGLVLISVLLLAFVLFMPMTQRGHGGHAKTQCLNNVRQLNLALQGFLSEKGAFPASGTYGESPLALGSGNPDDSVIRDTFRGRFSVATSGTPDVGPLYNWVVDILPYTGNDNLYNNFNRQRSYLDDGRPGDDPAHPTNKAISQTEIGIFVCPFDQTVSTDRGNLSYGVNLGFTRWHAEGNAYGWTGTKTGGSDGPSLDWGQAVASQTGVMQLGTSTGKAPWDHRTSSQSITDGLGYTILLAENVQAGASENSPYANGVTTNWACPHPNFCGFVASDDVCTDGDGHRRNCSTVGDLSEVGSTPGSGWKRANVRDSFEAINSGVRLGHRQQGSSPVANSLHPDGKIVVGMCDGSVRVISANIDGAVYSKLITPAGSSLPTQYRQGPLGPDDY